MFLVWIRRRLHHVFGVDKTEIAPPLPRPCCRKTFLASTVGDGKSELLKEKQYPAGVAESSETGDGG